MTVQFYKINYEYFSWSMTASASIESQMLIEIFRNLTLYINFKLSGIFKNLNETVT